MTIDWNYFLSEEGRLREGSVMTIPTGEDIVSLAAGLPNPKCFPLHGIHVDVQSPVKNFTTTDKISRIAETPRGEVTESCQYISFDGLTNFNAWVQKYLVTYFKPAYEDWNWIIQSGATQSLESIMRLLLNPGTDTILCESLTYSCFLETCIPLRVKLVPVEMDEFGLVPAKLETLLENWHSNDLVKSLTFPKLLYTMPTGHNPTGITLSTERRKQLLDVCNKFNILIVEDDPYYHLQLDNNRHIPSLVQFDTQGRVIRIDSFSKMLMPGLRVSIVTCNGFFRKKLSMHNELSIHSASGPSQLMLQMIFNEWGDTGFSKWLQHIQSMYRERRDLMLQAFDSHLPHELVTYNRPNYGMFIWVNAKLEKFKKPRDSKLKLHEWAQHIEDLIFKVASEKYRVTVTKGRWFMPDKSTPIAGFRVTYSYVDQTKINHAVQLLAQAIQEVHDTLLNA